MLNLHLYFLKLLGCYAVEYSVPLPTAHFGLCILNEVAHPSVRLLFVPIAPGSTKHIIQVGHIDALNFGGRTVSASWNYIVDTLGVGVSYNDPGHPRLTHERGWNPSDIGSRVCMAVTR